MKKTLKIAVVVVFAFSMCIGFFAACNTKTQLTMPVISYDDETKTLSWDIVKYAQGYTLKIGDTVKPDSEIIQNGSRREYIVKEAADGRYNVYITARGDGKKYSDSEPRLKTIDYTTGKKLEMSTITYNNTTKMLSWDKVANATGYTLTLNQMVKPAGAIKAAGTKMQYEIVENTDGIYAVTVVAKGDGVNYRDSEPKTSSANYTRSENSRIRENMAISLNELLGSESASFDYKISVDGGLKILGINFSISDLLTAAGQEVPSYEGEVYLSNGELFLLMDGGLDGKSGKQYAALPNMLQTLIPGDDTTVLPETMTAKEKAGGGYVLSAEVDLATFGEGTFDPLLEYANGFFADFIGTGIDIPMGVTSIKLNKITIETIKNPVIEVNFDKDYNVTDIKVTITLSGYAFTNLSTLPLDIHIIGELFPSDRVVPDDMYAYLEEEGYARLELSEMPVPMPLTVVA